MLNNTQYASAKKNITIKSDFNIKNYIWKFYGSEQCMIILIFIRFHKDLCTCINILCADKKMCLILQASVGILINKFYDSVQG